MQRRHSPKEVNLLKRRSNLVKGLEFMAEQPISRKRHPFDCGYSQCYRCNPGKFPRRDLTKQERLADLKLIEN